MHPSRRILLFVTCGSLMVAAAGYFLLSQNAAPEERQVSARPWRGSSMAALLGATQTGTSTVDASANSTSTASSTDTESDLSVPFSTTTYQYKIMQPVGPCGFNTLGGQGYRPIFVGSDPDTQSSLVQVAGKDAGCKSSGIYNGLLWVIFESSTSSTSNTITPDTASTVEYKMMTDVGPCTLNSLGAQGWRAAEAGTSLSPSGGYDETCKKSGVYNSLDWVLFERPLQ